MKAYDQIYTWYTNSRNDKIGLQEAEYLVKHLPKGSKVLDLGCGDGKPIAIYLSKNGFDVFGIDSSLKMIQEFQNNLPNAKWQFSDLLHSNFFNDTFDGIIAWGVMFHLNELNQKHAIEKISKHIRKGGIFIFTSAKAVGACKSFMNQVEFSYTSLGSENYCKLLTQFGFELISEYLDNNENYIYISKKNS